MRVLVLVVVLQWALAMENTIVTKTYKSISDHCTPGYFKILLDSGELCVYCICWGDMETCGTMQYRRCLGDNVVVRRLRPKRNSPVFSHTGVFTKDAVKKRSIIKLDEANPEKQREIYIRSSKARAFNAKKQSSDPNPTRKARNSDDKGILDKEVFGVFKRGGFKESEKILEEQQTLALIRNSKSRIIHTGKVMSVTTKPRFVRSHKKENGIKLNINQKRTSNIKDLEKKFKKQSRYRTKRQVDAKFLDKSSDSSFNKSDKPFQMEVFTDPQLSAEATTAFDVLTTTDGGDEETTVFDTETPGKIYWSDKLSDANNFYTTEQGIDTENPEKTKHLYDVTENIGEVANVDMPSYVNKFHVIAKNIPEANDIKFKDWSQLDTVKNNTNMFHWTKEQIKELSAKDSILLNKFKRIFRKKSNVIRTKTFTVDKSDRVYVTNMPSLGVANIKMKFPNTILKNITNIQYLLKEILIRLRSAHANEESKEEKIDNDFIWRLKDHEKKIKKHSHLLTSYKNLGSCAINTRKKQIIDSKVNELHNHTKGIFESIEFLKNIPITAAVTDRNIIKNNTEKFVKSVGKFAYLLNEIINIATCKRNNKSQRIMRHISRRQSHKPKVNEAVSKIKRLISRYSAVQNSFVSKMYEAIHSFDDNNTAKVKSASTQASYTTKLNNTAEMDAITIKITKNLMRLKVLVQNMNKGRIVKRDVTYEKLTELSKEPKNIYKSQSTISVTIPFYKEVNELITKVVGSFRQLNDYLQQDRIPIDDAVKHPSKIRSLLMKTVDELHAIDISDNNKDTAFDPSTKWYNNELDAFKTNFTRSLMELSKVVEDSHGLRTKRDVQGDNLMDMLILVEYMLKQNLAAHRPPVEDGIDALIEAIRKAPDVRTVKNRILGIHNFTDNNATDTERVRKSSVNKYGDKIFDNSNDIGSKIVKNNREGNISDMSSDNNSDTRLDDAINNLNQNQEKALEAYNEKDELDSGFEVHENIRPVKVDNNHADATTPAGLNKKVFVDSEELSESNDDSKSEVENVKISNLHKGIPELMREDDTFKYQNEENTVQERRYINRSTHNESDILSGKDAGLISMDSNHV